MRARALNTNFTITFTTFPISAPCPLLFLSYRAMPKSRRRLHAPIRCRVGGELLVEVPAQHPCGLDRDVAVARRFDELVLCALVDQLLGHERRVVQHAQVGERVRMSPTCSSREVRADRSSASQRHEDPKLSANT